VLWLPGFARAPYTTSQESNLVYALLKG
jgi:hypothetical protein